MDTKRRNQISPLLMEALQIIKFSLKQKRQLDFTDSWAAAESNMLDDGVDDGPDLLHGLSIGAEGAMGEMMTLDDEGPQ
jgi:hypothetical protein